jgi:hypothetical protein
MQLSLLASRSENPPLKAEFWTQLDADSGRSGHLGRDDSGIFHFSDYAVNQNLSRYLSQSTVVCTGNLAKTAGYEKAGSSAFAD